jgi:hypothetical protein
VAVIYSSPGRQHVLYERSGEVHDLSQKSKWRGGFYTDPSRAPGADQLKVQHEEAPMVDVALGATTVKLRTAICVHGRCIAHDNLPKEPDLGSEARITVSLPGVAKGPRFEVAVPSDGLQAALGELARDRSS